MGNKSSSSSVRGGEEGAEDPLRRKTRSNRRGKNTHSCPDLHGLDVALQGASSVGEEKGGKEGEGAVGEVKVRGAYKGGKGEVKRHVMLPAEPDVDIKVYRKSAATLSRAQSAMGGGGGAANRSNTLPRNIGRSRSVSVGMGGAGTLPGGKGGKGAPLEEGGRTTQRPSSVAETMSRTATEEENAVPCTEALAIKRKLLEFETRFTKHLSDLYSDLSDFVQLSALSLAVGPLPLTHPHSLLEYLTSEQLPLDLANSAEYRLTIPPSMFHGVMHVRRDGVTGREERVSLAQELFVCMAVEAAAELSAMFEYQVGLVAGTTEVDLLARHAAECAMSYLKTNHRFMDRNAVLRGVLSGAPPDPSHKVLSVIVVDRELKWVLDEVFKRPGLMIHTGASGDFPWKLYTSETSDPKTYGYRTVMMERDFITGGCRVCEDEVTSFPTEVELGRADDLHRGYRPRQRRVDANENVELRTRWIVENSIPEERFSAEASGEADVVRMGAAPSPQYIICTDASTPGSPDRPLTALTTIRGSETPVAETPAEKFPPTIESQDVATPATRITTIRYSEDKEMEKDVDAVSLQSGSKRGESRPVSIQPVTKLPDSRVITPAGSQRSLEIRNEANIRYSTDASVERPQPAERRMPDLLLYSTPKPGAESRAVHSFIPPSSQTDIRSIHSTETHDQSFNRHSMPVLDNNNRISVNCDLARDSTDVSPTQPPPRTPSSGGKVPPRVPVRKTPYAGEAGHSPDAISDEPQVLMDGRFHVPPPPRQYYPDERSVGTASPTPSSRSSVRSERVGSDRAPIFTSDSRYQFTGGAEQRYSYAGGEQHRVGVRSPPPPVAPKKKPIPASGGGAESTKAGDADFMNFNDFLGVLRASESSDILTNLNLGGAGGENRTASPLTAQPPSAAAAHPLKSSTRLPPPIAAKPSTLRPQSAIAGYPSGGSQKVPRFTSDTSPTSGYVAGATPLGVQRAPSPLVAQRTLSPLVVQSAPSPHTDEAPIEIGGNFPELRDFISAIAVKQPTTDDSHGKRLPGSNGNYGNVTPGNDLEGRFVLSAENAVETRVESRDYDGTAPRVRFVEEDRSGGGTGVEAKRVQHFSTDDVFYGDRMASSAEAGSEAGVLVSDL